MRWRRAALGDQRLRLIPHRWHKTKLSVARSHKKAGALVAQPSRFSF
jgi:hypothetical protein